MAGCFRAIAVLLLLSVGKIAFFPRKTEKTEATCLPFPFRPRISPFKRQLFKSQMFPYLQSSH